MNMIETTTAIPSLRGLSPQVEYPGLRGLAARAISRLQVGLSGADRALAKFDRWLWEGDDRGCVRYHVTTYQTVRQINPDGKEVGSYQQQLGRTHTYVKWCKDRCGNIKDVYTKDHAPSTTKRG